MTLNNQFHAPDALVAGELHPVRTEQENMTVQGPVCKLWSGKVYGLPPACIP